MLRKCDGGCHQGNNPGVLNMKGKSRGDPQKYRKIQRGHLSEKKDLNIGEHGILCFRNSLPIFHESFNIQPYNDMYPIPYIVKI